MSTLRTGRSGHGALQSAKMHDHDKQIGDRSFVSTGRSGHKGLTPVRREKPELDPDLQLAIELQAKEDAKLLGKELHHPTMRTGRSGQMGLQSPKMHDHDKQIGDRSFISTGRSGHKGLTPTKREKPRLDPDEAVAIEVQAREDVKTLTPEIHHPTMRTGRSGQMGLQSPKMHDHDSQIGDRSFISTGRSGHKGLTPTKREKPRLELDEVVAIELQAQEDVKKMSPIHHPTMRTGRSGQMGLQSPKMHDHDKLIGERSFISTGRSSHKGLTPVKREKPRLDPEEIEAIEAQAREDIKKLSLGH